MFTEIVLDLIAKNGITKNKMLKDLKMGTGTFATWEKRGTIPSGETLSKIADYFGVSTDYLLGDKNKSVTDNGNGLSESEAQLIKLFNSVPEESRALVVGMIEAALKSHGLLK